MKIFKYEQYQLSLEEPEILLVKEFADVLKSDKSKDKKKAFQIFTYVYLMVDWKSPYVDYSKETKHQQALSDSGLSEKEIEKELIQNALNKYKEIQDSNMTLSLIREMKESIEKFKSYYQILDFTKEVESGAKKGTMLFSPIEYLNVMKRSAEIFEAVELMEKKLKEELKQETGARGNVEQPLEIY